MVIGNISDSFRYDTLSPAIAEALAWLRNNLHMSGFENRKEIILANGDIVVKCQEVNLKPSGECRMEAHRDWIDIQVAIDTPESIGWAPLSACKEGSGGGWGGGGGMFFTDAPQCEVPVNPGQFMILYPEDVHAPNIGSGPHRKYVVKVKVGK